MGINTENGFVEYRHIHSGISRLPAVTIKFDVNQTDGVVKCSFAACSPDDNFARAVGRKVSDERMNEGQYVTFEYNRDLSLINNVVSYLNDIMEENTQPPEEVPTKELARVFYYMDYILGVKEFREQTNNMESPESGESQIIVPVTNIIGA